MARTSKHQFVQVVDKSDATFTFGVDPNIYESGVIFTNTGDPGNMTLPTAVGQAGMVISVMSLGGNTFAVTGAVVQQIRVEGDLYDEVETDGVGAVLKFISNGTYWIMIPTGAWTSTD